MKWLQPWMLPMLLSALLISSTADAQQNPRVVYSDDFSNYQEGSDGSPEWRVTKGDWLISKGQYCQQNKGEYDCASLLDIYLNESYSIEVSFRLQDGNLGVGFFFSSASARSTNFSQMVRFEEGQSVLFGHFRAGEYTADQVQKVKPIADRNVHKLRLEVDRSNDSYGLFLDGEAIRSNVPLVYRSGYIGLQTSSSAVCFDNLTVTSAGDTASLSPLHWATFMALNARGELLVPSRQMSTVHVYDRQGKYQRSIGTPARERGQLQSPQGIALLPNGDVVVSDIDLNRVHIFGENGAWKRGAGGKGSGKGEFDEPASVATFRDTIFVADRNNSRVQMFNDSLRFLGEFGKPELDKPAGIAIEDSLIYVVNSGKPTVEVFSRSGPTVTWSRSIPYGAGEGRGITAAGGYFYVSVGAEVKRFDREGFLRDSFSARSIGGVYPWGIARIGAGNVIIADHLGSRFIVTDPVLHEPTPSVTFLEPTRVRITWSTVKPVLSNLELDQAGQVSTLSEASARTEHEFTFGNLPPSIVLHYRFTPSVETIPPMSAKPQRYTFISPPAPGKKHYRRFPIAVLLFANVTDEAKRQPDWPPMPPLSEDEIRRIEGQIRDGVQFYWVNSRMSLFLDVDFVVVKEPWNRGDLFDGQFSWYPPRKGNVETYLAAAGRDPTKYDGVLYLAGVRDYDSTLKRYVLRGAGGAFTNGVTAGYGYGISWWEVTKANHNAGNNWLFVHEFNHQLDDLFLMNGYPEYWFNHFSVSIGTAARFGEHFDGNAYMLRSVEDPWWFDLSEGSMVYTNDRDGDGIPEDDPALPLDEKRFGSNPYKRDSDEDGLSDLEEVVLSNWVIEGWGETRSASALKPDPMNPDTDQDGLIDSEDPYPLLAAKPEIERGSPLIDGALQPGEWQAVSSINDPHVKGEVYSRWDESYLYFALECDRMLPAKVQLDANADGWFVGRDNYLIRFTPKNSQTVDVSVQLFDASNVRVWPQMNDELAAKVKPTAVYGLQDSSYVLEVAIPKDPNTGIDLFTGEEFGLIAGFLCPFDSEGNSRYVVLFEPNKFFYARLK